MTKLTDREVLARKRRGHALIAAGRDSAGHPLRVAVLCSFNVDSLAPFLAEALGRHGAPSALYFGPFGQIARELIDPSAELDRFAPDLVVVIPAAEDLLLPLFRRPGALSGDDIEALVADRLAELRQWIGSFLVRQPSANLLAVTFGTDRLPGPHLLHSQEAARGEAAVIEFVEGIRRLDTASPRVVAVDWDWHTRRDGWASFRDDRLWYLGRMRLNLAGSAQLAELIAEHVAALHRAPRKVVAVDLDNTLWGGVVGEVGVGGLELGAEGVGLAFQEFQRELLKWHDAGVLLAVCSKNNPDDALAAIDQHPDQVLRREHFAAFQVNWRDKATNLRALARELNLGLESFVFLDDNPVEREWVARALPEVLVPELPADPVDRPALLRDLPDLRRMSLTEADRSRSQSYRTAAIRNQLKERAACYDDYLASLQQALEIAPLGPSTVPRAAQLCQRTNQFNLTTRRYTAAELEALLSDADASAFTLSVRDRFEDSGITGLAILRYRAEAAEIDSLLLSCRVLGRRIEDAFLAFLARSARARGARSLIGRHVPTEKNVQVAALFPDHGFDPTSDGRFLLQLEDESRLPAFPPHLTMTVL